jgi:hypothetical protein
METGNDSANKKNGGYTDDAGEKICADVSGWVKV